MEKQSVITAKSLGDKSIIRNRVTNEDITKNFRDVFETLILKEGYEPRFNCCGIHGYEDFSSSHSFIEDWGEPRHSVVEPYAINFSVACCNSIEITLQFQGPCRADDYIDKRGCIYVFWETADTYQTSVVTIVAIACLIQVWDTENGDDNLEEEDKWSSGARRKPMKKSNRSLVMDF
ncbi:unnamed protein product [Mytilus edulis]|uniref:Uncharacterized protein n=1 Tax=Mytilus edulis TaxID=6550 RepID=A0A8S3RJ05_MYTED|nr:unnamed protein product [Mytilus edulis]